MEEILASIRRIIADDEAKPPVAEKAPNPISASTASCCKAGESARCSTGPQARDGQRSIPEQYRRQGRRGESRSSAAAEAKSRACACTGRHQQSG